MRDVRSDRLEIEGDLLPTPAELEEMAKYFDEMEAACPLPQPRGLAGAGSMREVADHGFGFGF